MNSPLFRVTYPTFLNTPEFYYPKYIYIYIYIYRERERERESILGVMQTVTIGSQSTATRSNVSQIYLFL